MPWEIVKNGDRFCVRKQNGSVVPGGCHPTREKALGHMKALYANEDSMTAAYITVDQARAAASAPAPASSTLVHADGPKAAGVAVHALDTGRVLFIQRALIDGEPNGGLWEIPGGNLDEGESPWDGAQREFAEETGHPLPDGQLVGTWISPNGVYQGFVWICDGECDHPLDQTDPENRAIVDPDNADGSNYTESQAWMDPAHLDRGPRLLRPEMRTGTPWKMLKNPSLTAAGEQEETMENIEEIVVPAGTRLRIIREPGDNEAVVASVVPPEDDDFAALVASLAQPMSALIPESPLDGPTPYTVNDDGTADGHLALWASCHIGYPGCVKPPREDSFDFYNLGDAVTADGRHVAVGKVTVGIGHAGADLSWRTASAHYDHAGHVAAAAHAIADRWGIRLPSVLVADAKSEQIDQLRRSPLSGDWRRINGKLRLVAALGVNVPGFPVPRAMVAAGEVQSMFVGFDPEDAAALVLEADSLAASIGLDPASRAAQLRASVVSG